MMELTCLSDAFWVSAQISEDDLTQLAQEGYTDVICYRPDDEHPDGPVSARMAQACDALGLCFHHHPIVPGDAFDGQAQDLTRLLSKPDVKICAYCRTGARATNAFTLATATD